MAYTEQKLSLSCHGLCQESLFKQRFKVLKQISGRIEAKIRRWYWFCSRCSIWIRARAWGLCKCCGQKLRTKARDSGLSKGKRYYRNNKAKCQTNYKQWAESHDRREYYRQYRLSKK